MKISMSRASLLLFAAVSTSAFAGEAAKTDIRGAALGMHLAEAIQALTKNGGICGQAVFDTHRCDFDSDTWVHLHVIGPDKIVTSIKYYFPPLNDDARFARFTEEVVSRFKLQPVDNRTRYVSSDGLSLTLTDGEIDFEKDPGPVQSSPEPKL